MFKVNNKDSSVSIVNSEQVKAGWVHGIFIIKESLQLFDTTQKKSFPLRISLVNVTKSTGNCGFGHIY